VVDLYKYNTIAGLAKHLEHDAGETEPSFSEVNQRANRQKEIMKQRRELAHAHAVAKETSR